MPLPDKYGHCVLCHKNMLTEQVIDKKVTLRFTPDYDETEYLLNDGSRMRVAVCKQCKAGLTEKDTDKIMKCVIEGWKLEVEGIKSWDEIKKMKHMEVYSKKKIITNCERLPKDIIEKKLEE